MFRTAFSRRVEPKRHRDTKFHREPLCAFVSLCLRGSKKVAIILLLCFFACRQEAKQPSLPYYNTPDFTPEFISGKEALQKITHTIAPFSFEDESGSIVTSKMVQGKIHVANFMFTSCGSICPKMTDNLSKVSDAFAKDSNVVLLSYSVTTWIDKEARSITNPAWHFLTGDKGRIYNLARQSYFAEEDMGFTKDSTEFLHTEHILLVDGCGRIRGIYNGTLQLEVEQLIRDIQTLKKED